MRYNSPAILEEFISWEKEFASKVPYLERPSGLFLEFVEEPGGYMCTPLDSYTFARTGGDGEHFALLTDFGLYEDLDNAPVISVCPMNFDASLNVRIVARNVCEFLWLQLNHEMLLLCDFESENEYVEYRTKDAQDQSTDYFDHKLWLEQKELVKKVAQEVFQFPEIQNPYQYIKEIREERNIKTILKTKDTLGILPLSKKTSVDQHPWVKYNDLPSNLTDELESFFDTAPLETKLAFVRDYQAECTQDKESLMIICNELERNGFLRESKMLRACLDI